MSHSKDIEKSDRHIYSKLKGEKNYPHSKSKALFGKKGKQFIKELEQHKHDSVTKYK